MRENWKTTHSGEHAPIFNVVSGVPRLEAVEFLEQIDRCRTIYDAKTPMTRVWLFYVLQVPMTTHLLAPRDSIVMNSW